jgi:predicted nucleotidyltransferase
MANVRDQHREGILIELQKVSHVIRNRYGVIRIGLFGSAARGELSPESDIDLLVELDPKKTSFRRYLELEEYLTKLFDRKIDLVTLDGISPYVLPYIQKDVIWCER